jgi:phosphoglycerol transferase MdoB-like AlkP superfamily enzyme
MSELLQATVGIMLMLAAWLIPRHIANARMAGLPAVLLDLSPVLLVAGLLLTATGRPIFTGLALVSLGAGFALADRTKREALREPIVFSDISELPHVFTHPQLYLPFAGAGLVIGGALATIVLAVAFLSVEPLLWEPDALLIVALVAVVCAAGWVISREPALSTAAAAIRRLGPIDEPFADAERLGPFAILLVYGIIARAERNARRVRHAPPPAPALVSAAAAVPLVIVQCESFFDARRVSPSVPEDLLPGFDDCLRHGATFGRLEVASWGANTTRAEFAVLTGIPERDLGYDRFNPYHAFARAPVASLAWRLRNEGYRTLCLHPFDRGFFRRDLTLKALGFEDFLGRESLGGSSRPPYRSDPDLAHQVLRVLEEVGPRTFIFVITMGNHGPWSEAGPPIDTHLRQRFDTAGVPQGGQFLRYLDGLARSDEMLRILSEGLGPRGHDGVLSFYGDHQPSLPQAFGHFGFEEWASDYILVDSVASSARRLDMPADHLPRVILDRLYERNAVEGRRAVALGAA